MVKKALDPDEKDNTTEKIIEASVSATATIFLVYIEASVGATATFFHVCIEASVVPLPQSSMCP